MKKAYISGKITGIENQAEGLFNEAEQEVRDLGFEPVNPMKLNHEHDQSWEAYMKEDIKALCDCDVIYMLNNYKDSLGARVELNLANNLKIKVIRQFDMQRGKDMLDCELNS